MSHCCRSIVRLQRPVWPNHGTSWIVIVVPKCSKTNNIWEKTLNTLVHWVVQLSQGSFFTVVSIYCNKENIITNWKMRKESDKTPRKERLSEQPREPRKSPRPATRAHPTGQTQSQPGFLVQAIGMLVLLLAIWAIIIRARQWLNRR